MKIDFLAAGALAVLACANASAPTSSTVKTDSTARTDTSATTTNTDLPAGDHVDCVAPARHVGASSRYQSPRRSPRK